MGSDGDLDFARRVGALVLGTANDLKRNDRLAASELGLGLDEWREVVQGHRKLGWATLRRIADVWPVSERDLLPVRDDRREGAVVMTAEESRRTARRLTRGGVEYYEYRDTAMSRLAGFRPEWIRMMVEVSSNDPSEPRLQWNKGHLLSQFTYFIGPVNYYWECAGVRRCSSMNTGDSVWGVPFMPHTFATRDGREDSRILALTYTAEFSGDALAEAAVLGPDVITPRSQEPLTGPNQFDPHLLRLHMSHQMIPASELARLSNLRPSRLAEIIAGTAVPGRAEECALADALRIGLRDMLGVPTDTSEGVVINRCKDARKWPYPDADRPWCLVRELAASRMHPWARGLELTVLPGWPDGAPIRIEEHQYLFHLRGGPVRLEWTAGVGSGRAELRADDSCYLAPGTRFQLQLSMEETADLLIQRVPGKLSTESRYALGAIEPAARIRVCGETMQWYAE